MPEKISVSKIRGHGTPYNFRISRLFKKRTVAINDRFKVRLNQTNIRPLLEGRIQIEHTLFCKAALKKRQYSARFIMGTKSCRFY